MRRQSFRTRPLNLNRPVKVVKSVSGITFEDENGNKRHVAADSLRIGAVVEKKIITYNIPIPVIKTVSDYEKQIKPDFKLSSAYLRGRKRRESEIQKNTIYNLTHVDREWLNSNALIGPNGTIARVNPKLLERMLDIFAKENQTRSRAAGSRARAITRPSLSPSDAEEIVMTRLQIIGPAACKVAAEVRVYWEMKMRKLKKSLLRTYWPQTSESDPNPHHTFRAMENSSVPTLRPFRRHKGMEAFLFMEALRKDLSTTRQMLGQVKKREEVKRRILQHRNELFEQAMFDCVNHRNIPPPTITLIGTTATNQPNPTSETLTSKNDKADESSTKKTPNTSKSSPKSTQSSALQRAIDQHIAMAARLKKQGKNTILSSSLTSGKLSDSANLKQRPLNIDLVARKSHLLLKFGSSMDSIGGFSMIPDKPPYAAALSSVSSKISRAQIREPLIPSFLFPTGLDGCHTGTSQHMIHPTITTYPPCLPVVDYGGVLSGGKMLEDEDTEYFATPQEVMQFHKSDHPLARTQRTFMCRKRIGRGGRLLIDRIPCRKILSGVQLAALEDDLIYQIKSAEEERARVQAEKETAAKNTNDNSKSGSTTKARETNNSGSSSSPNSSQKKGDKQAPSTNSISSMPSLLLSKRTRSMKSKNKKQKVPTLRRRHRKRGCPTYARPCCPTKIPKPVRCIH